MRFRPLKCGCFNGKIMSHPLWGSPFSRPSHSRWLSESVAEFTWGNDHWDVRESWQGPMISITVCLVGGLEHRFFVHNILGIILPNWRTRIFKMAKTTNQSQSLWLVNGWFFSKWPWCENDDLPMDGTGMNGVMLVKHSKAMSWTSHVLMVYITIHHTFMVHLGIKSHLEILTITDGCWGNLGRWRPNTKTNYS